jgi:hypothetical protein
MKQQLTSRLLGVRAFLIAIARSEIHPSIQPANFHVHASCTTSVKVVGS